MRVCIVPEYPESLMTGGVQVQARETCRALVKVGVDAEMFVWSGSRPLASIYHFIGFPQHLACVADLMREGGKPYVCTILAGSVRNPWRIRVARGMFAISKRMFRARRQYYHALAHASAVIAITPADRAVLRQVYRVPNDRLFVVPNGVSEPFRVALPTPWQQVHGEAPFVLCVGAVQPRKNQLLLLRICNELKIPMVLLGAILPGEAIYARQVAEAAKVNAEFGGKWVQHLQQDDPLLPSAFAACKAFILLSRSETQPLSVLQAMAARRPILLAQASYTSEYPFDGLVQTGCSNHARLREAVRRVWSAGQATELPPEFSWDNVATSLWGIYTQILDGRHDEDAECDITDSGGALEVGAEVVNTHRAQSQ